MQVTGMSTAGLQQVRFRMLLWGGEGQKTRLCAKRGNGGLIPGSCGICQSVREQDA